MFISIICFIITEKPHKWRGFYNKVFIIIMLILYLPTFLESWAWHYSKHDRMFLRKPIISKAKISDLSYLLKELLSAQEK